MLKALIKIILFRQFILITQHSLYVLTVMKQHVQKRFLWNTLYKNSYHGTPCTEIVIRERLYKYSYYGMLCTKQLIWNAL